MFIKIASELKQLIVIKFINTHFLPPLAMLRMLLQNAKEK